MSTYNYSQLVQVRYASVTIPLYDVSSQEVGRYCLGCPFFSVFLGGVSLVSSSVVEFSGFFFFSDLTENLVETESDACSLMGMGIRKSGFGK